MEIDGGKIFKHAGRYFNTKNCGGLICPFSGKSCGPWCPMCIETPNVASIEDGFTVLVCCGHNVIHYYGKD